MPDLGEIVDTIELCRDELRLAQAVPNLRSTRGYQESEPPKSQTRNSFQNIFPGNPVVHEKCPVPALED